MFGRGTGNILPPHVCIWQRFALFFIDRVMSIKYRWYRLRLHHLPLECTENELEPGTTVWVMTPAVLHYCPVVRNETGRNATGGGGIDWNTQNNTWARVCRDIIGGILFLTAPWTVFILVGFVNFHDNVSPLWRLQFLGNKIIIGQSLLECNVCNAPAENTDRRLIV